MCLWIDQVFIKLNYWLQWLCRELNLVEGSTYLLWEWGQFLTCFMKFKFMELSFLLKYCYCSCITIFIVHKMWSQLIYLAVYAYCLQTSYTYDVWICLQACTPQPAPYCQGCRTPSFREDNLSQVRNWPPEWSVYNHLYYVTYM